MIKTHVAGLAAKHKADANFLVIHLDRLSQEQYRQAEQIYLGLGAEGFPTAVFLDAQGNKVEMLTGEKLTINSLTESLQGLTGK